MVSNASDDLPEPESPVMTVSRFRGIATEMFLRLCSRAPRTRRNSSDISPGTYRSARRHSSRRAPVLGIGRRSGGRLRPRPATFLSLPASYRSNLEERRMPLLKGTLDVLVLKALSFGPRHGFEITRWIEDGSHGEFPIESAALLQALHRLEERRLVTAAWGVTGNNRRARYYSLTPSGRAHLRAEAESLRSSVAALSALLAARTARTAGG